MSYSSMPSMFRTQASLYAVPYASNTLSPDIHKIMPSHYFGQLSEDPQRDLLQPNYVIQKVYSFSISLNCIICLSKPIILLKNISCLFMHCLSTHWYCGLGLFSAGLNAHS